MGGGRPGPLRTRDDLMLDLLEWSSETESR